MQIDQFRAVYMFVGTNLFHIVPSSLGLISKICIENSAEGGVELLCTAWNFSRVKQCYDCFDTLVPQ